MALTDMVFELPPFTETPRGGANMLIDADSELAAHVIQIPKDGIVSELGFRTGTVAAGGGSERLTASLETLSSGFPSGTDYGGSAPWVASAAPASNTSYTEALATSATANHGDFVAVVIGWSVRDSATANIRMGNLQGLGQNFPYCASYVGAPAWTKQNVNRRPLTWLKYSDGSYAHLLGTHPGNPTSRAIEDNDATADEMGNRFTLPFAVRSCGAWCYAYPWSSASTFDIVLYDGADSIIASTSFDGDTRSTNDFYLMQAKWADAPVELAADTTYRLVVKPTDTATHESLTVYWQECQTAAILGQLSLGTNCFRTYRVDAGSWIDVTTDRMAIGLLCDQLNGGGGAAGLLLPDGMVQ